jgi:3-oxoacyl-[acyl-carrier protein] reductase
MINLSKRHVFVAGGSRGIGRATALLAAKAGADVTINYVKDEASAQSLAGEIKGLGRQALCVQADLTKPDQVDNAFDASALKLGPIHGLAVSAGIFEGCPVKDMTLEFWNRTIQQNLTTTFLAVKAGARHMQAQKGGSIVIFTSTAGQRGSSVFSAYATSKGAQIMFMRSMAKELAPDRIRVNCVAPGWTETDMSREAMDKEGREGIIKSIPLGRIGRPEDPGAAALYLMSDLAQFITGSTITVDGGFDMRG